LVTLVILKRGKREEVTEMGWEKGRYYTRSKKVNGRVVREYLGAGRVAALAARLDAQEREEKEMKRAELKALRAELDALDAPLNELHRQTELLTRVALILAGFHQHHRGEWRKRRGNRQPAELGHSDRSEGDPEVA
jgi:hypothetical protein